MQDAVTISELTPEQNAALDNAGGIVQGDSFVLMRPDAVHRFFGFDNAEDLRRELPPGLDQADRGELIEWNLVEFLDRMHRGHKETE